MKTLITYYKSTGKIKNVITTNAPLTIDNYVDSDFSAIIVEAAVSADEYYVKDNSVLPYPDKPDDGFYSWDGQSWTIDLERARQRALGLRWAYLQESDWTDTVSAPTRLGVVRHQAWQDYRQELRDITLQDNYPTEVVWPLAP